MKGYGEKVRTWRRGGFVLELWDTHRPTGTGYLAHTALAYRLSDRGRVIFQGRIFIPPVRAAIDSDECVAACLVWFTLRPGDVEPEYFQELTTTQRVFVESGRADDLAIHINQMRKEGRGD